MPSSSFYLDVPRRKKLIQIDGNGRIVFFLLVFCFVVKTLIFDFLLTSMRFESSGYFSDQYAETIVWLRRDKRDFADRIDNTCLFPFLKERAISVKIGRKKSLKFVCPSQSDLSFRKLCISNE